MGISEGSYGYYRGLAGREVNYSVRMPFGEERGSKVGTIVLKRRFFFKYVPSKIICDEDVDGALTYIFFGE